MRDEVGRLRHRPDFLRVAGTRQKAVAPGLILQVGKRGDVGDAQPAIPRVGFTVTRKVGSAVVRNRARRRLKAAAAAIFPAHALPGLDYVVIGRGATLGRPFILLIEDLTTAMRRLNAYRNQSESPTA
ncbi:MAG: ribonuclease P protein component [Rhodospirillaceae bacterium]|nr:ribonuclease P protein component [Rhodospirillaceae bacterium]